MKATSEPALRPVPPSTMRPPKYQATKLPLVVMKARMGNAVDHMDSAWTVASRSSALRPPKSRTSLGSWLKALTTRMPLMVSVARALKRARRCQSRW